MNTLNVYCRIWMGIGDDCYFEMKTLPVSHKVLFASWNIHKNCMWYGYSIRKEVIPDLSVLSEEEFFQRALVWDHQYYSIELMREVHKYAKECFALYEGGSFGWKHTIQY